VDEAVPVEPLPLPQPVRSKVAQAIKERYFFFIFPPPSG